MLIVALLLLLAVPAYARAPQASCKDIRAAVAANRTLEQIVQDFNTTAERVTKCTQKRGKRRATKTQKHQQPAQGKHTQKSHQKHAETTAEPHSGSPTSDAPHATSRPRVRRPGPQP